MKGNIWVLNRDHGIKQLKIIEKNYNRLKINTTRRAFTKNYAWVEFENGDIWRVCPCTLSHGQRANISYIEYGIPQDFIDQVIKPCTYSLPYNAFKYFYGDEE